MFRLMTAINLFGAAGCAATAPLLAAICLACMMPLPVHALAIPESDLVRLARSLDIADPLQRFEFADAVLEVLQNSYRDELVSSGHAQSQNPERRAKLQSWRRGTQALLDQLETARLRLGEGAEVSISVDAQHQVLLFIDELPVAFSAPRPGTEIALERTVIARYCAFNDCAVLEGSPGDTLLDAPSGSWSMGDRQTPGYALDNGFRCGFRDFARRDEKQQACEAAAAEATILLAALRQIADRGRSLDWQGLASDRRVNGPDIALYPLASGSPLQMALPRLAHLDQAAWASFTVQLRAAMQRSDMPITIERGELLLAR